MENEEITPAVEHSNALRKYVLSPVTIPIILISIYISWKYFYTSFDFGGTLLILGLSVFAGIYPVRVKSRFIGNEYYLNDFVMVLGIAMLDPFQLAIAFTIGTSLSHVYSRMSAKRIYLNTYCNFYVGLITAMVVRAPVETNRWFFALILALGLITYYLVDAISYYAVCKFPASEMITCLVSPERLVSMTFGFVMGLPAVLLIDMRPEFSFVMILIYCVFCFSFNRYSTLLTKKDQYEQIVNFMIDTVDNSKFEKSEQRIIDIAKNAFRHEAVFIQCEPPKDASQIGEIIYSDDKGDHWLIVNKNDVSSARNETDAALLKNIVAASRRAFEHKELYDKLFMAARHDSLTGLSNRGTLEEYVNHELGLVKRNQTQFCIMFIDIDDFKPVNDIHGHKAGDELLKCIARRLTLTVRAQDVVARIGGDEFVILCRDISIEEAEKLANRIVEEIAKPVFVDRELDESNPFDNKSSEPRIEVKVNSSIGISQSPADGITFENLIRAADERMYEAKKLKNSSRTFVENNSDESHIAEVG